jgi:predicted SAM-dependent methyltransferase
MPKTMLNLGCGHRFHRDWINIDIEPASPDVRRHDLSRGIPMPDASCSVVYHSHMLEHLRRDDARAFLRECLRVLEPGGVIRIATPDLERICRDYLAALERIDRGEPHARDDAEWMRLELYDQTVRERSGGAMAEFFARGGIANPGFVRERIGAEADAIRAALTAPPSKWPGFARALRFASRQARRIAVAIVAGRSGLRAFDAGTFRFAGEVHQWLYDRHLLSDLLRETGFAEPSMQSATTSRIANWSAFELDAGADGAPFKPDSMYIEAVRPK